MSTPSRPNILFDPRIPPLIAALNDNQVATVLRQMCEAWTPEENPDDLVAGGPDNNRGLLLEVAGMNVAMGGEPEFATLKAFIARATADPTA
ncbi:hypothetical protein K2Z83_15565 [Oscillochloris sp. ZM17-4]|uniref:hypothetical protein n=1 Tax=Oscillochloris sp. ZM17-4 TaxID=2866714 RepID=UPI001C73218C|nr:hypothetical protein [Oscillochloris sp. ZM17-4]MBX0329095.1 hypothetical protein [Oscillochloris sp. ZM17-4]